AVECLMKDRDVLLQFYSYPREHWKHIRSTNPIESTFATVRLRTNSTRGMGTATTTFAMVFKLLESAQKRWQRVFGYKLIPHVLEGRKYKDGLEVKKAA
ncbi:transposase, partial [Chitinivibrio alkaliphilus]|uniref:transposase n=1 Tax=Chitinivibrio alkaliphilus TaxID=1505232 RepID=UPI0018730AE7